MTFLESTESATNSDARTCTCHPSDHPPRPCPRKFALTECRVAALAEAVAQLLDDMGKRGQSVCLAAKAQARIAFEPFRNTDNYSGDGNCMSLEEAEEISAPAL